MLHFLPAPYPDELWYSVLCRYHIRSGNPSQRQTSLDIFGHQKQKVSVEFATELHGIMKTLGARFIPVEDILQNHTLLPYFARFWNNERKQQVVTELIKGVRNAVHTVGMHRINGMRLTTFRYCPQCYHEDISHYGEPFWHRAHQLPDIRICTKHSCFLSLTDVLLRDTNWTYRPALTGMSLSSITKQKPSAQELELSSLFMKNLTAPIEMESDGHTYQLVFQKEMSKRFKRSLTGKRTFVNAVCREMQSFFEPFVDKNDLEPNRMRIALSTAGQEVPRIILIAAYFFELSLEDLFTPPPPDNSIMEAKALYAQGHTKRFIANKFHASEVTITKLLGYDEPQERLLTLVNLAKKRTNWDLLDETTLPRVKAVINEAGKGKPQNITYAFVANELGDITAWELFQMPKCKHLIQNNYEPIEVTWERRVSWVQEQYDRDNVEVSQEVIFTSAGVDRRKFKKRVGRMAL